MARAAYTSLVLRSLKQAFYSDRNLGHAGPRQPRLRPLHLADPPLPGPDRPPGAALGDRRGRGRARPRRGRARPARGARSASARRRRSSATPTSVCAAFLLERELFESRLEARLRGRGLGRDRRRRLRPLRRRARRRLRGLPSGAAAPRRALRPQRDRDRAGRRAERPARSGSATRSRSGSTGSRRRAGRVDLVPVGDGAMAVDRHG